MAEHRRPPGTLPRPLSFLAGLTLAGVTAVAVWALPLKTRLDQAEAARADSRPQPRPSMTSSARPGANTSPIAEVVHPQTPEAFVKYQDTEATPTLDLPWLARQTGVRWFMLGHVVTGSAPCTPNWKGRTDQNGEQLADSLTRLRATGGNALIAFGTPGPDATASAVDGSPTGQGRDLAATCAGPPPLADAYRRVLRAFDTAQIAFEIDDADPAVTLRRAQALRILQQEFHAEGDRLRVTFTLPPGRARQILRVTREAGVTVDTVNFLAPIEPQNAPEGRLRRLAATLREGRRAVSESMGLTDPAAAWRSIAITPVLAASADLSELDARKLTLFADRHRLAWLSHRGAVPAGEVMEILTRSRR